jgi:hypothetical protein
LVTSSICQSISLGSFTTNGVRHTVSLSWSMVFRRHYYLISSTIYIGDIIYFNVLGQHFLVLGSLRRTTDLFEKRSSNYSDRLQMPMFIDLYVSNCFHLNN